jgi:hypothetical protein
VVEKGETAMPSDVEIMKPREAAAGRTAAAVAAHE